jgi:Protein of unknown function, DUF547
VNKQRQCELQSNGHECSAQAAPVRSSHSSCKRRLAWFGAVRYNIGGMEFSCNDIEHGVLRGNAPSPASLGVLLGRPRWASNTFKKKDPRARLVRVQGFRGFDPCIIIGALCALAWCGTVMPGVLAPAAPDACHREFHIP